MTNELLLGGVNPFSVNVNKMNLTTDSPARHSAPHIHDLCEIYVNLTGNVSFIVEKNVYAVQAGDIVITKPYEYHHCIYHDNSDHLHYWILFSPHENPDLFDFFLQRKRGTDNLIRLPEPMRAEFLALCEKLTVQNGERRASTLAVFFEVIATIAKGLAKYNVSVVNEHLPQNMREILDYINQNYASIHSVRDIANEFHISITTLERYFKTYLSLTPKRYWEDKKLSHACRLLRRGATVTEACFDSGFDDYSHFIAIFKKNFHATPLQYKKNLDTDRHV